MKKSFLTCFRGFSLIELLISLIIISVITAAFAPVISKKLQKGKTAISANKVRTDCPEDKYGKNCQICDNEKCLLRLCMTKCAGNQYNDSNCVCQNCTKFGANCKTCTEYGCTSTYCTNTCGGSQYRDDNCVCQNCAAKYGANCLSCNETSCLTTTQTAEAVTCPSGEYNSGSACIPCPSGYYCTNSTKTLCGNLKYQDETGKTSCKDCIGTGTNSAHTKCCKYGTVVKDGECYDPCKAVGIEDAFFIPTYNSTKGICMMKHNYGDSVIYDDVSGRVEKVLFARASQTTLAPKDALYSSANYAKTQICWRSNSGVSLANTYPGGTDRKTTYEYSYYDLYENYNSYDYGFSNRTVCTQNAAELLCKFDNIGYCPKTGACKNWRLPTYLELDYINDKLAKKECDTLNHCLGSDGLQLLLWGSDTGSCKGERSDDTSSNYGYCHASSIWGTDDAADEKKANYLDGYERKVKKKYKVGSASVRCVIDVSF